MKLCHQGSLMMELLDGCSSCLAPMHSHRSRLLGTTCWHLGYMAAAPLQDRRYVGRYQPWHLSWLQPSLGIDTRPPCGDCMQPTGRLEKFLLFDVLYPIIGLSLMVCRRIVDCRCNKLSPIAQLDEITCEHVTGFKRECGLEIWCKVRQGWTACMPTPAGAVRQAAWNFTYGAILVFTFPGAKPPRIVDFSSQLWLDVGSNSLSL